MFFLVISFKQAGHWACSLGNLKMRNNMGAAAVLMYALTQEGAQSALSLHFSCGSFHYT
jgi:hypothetical protein